MTYTLDGEVVDLGEFIEANLEGLAPEEITAARALRPGESMKFGGGAAPLVTLSCRLDPKEILDDPCASDWIKDALRKALDRDPVDALGDAELLVEVLKGRAV